MHFINLEWSIGFPRKHLLESLGFYLNVQLLFSLNNADFIWANNFYFLLFG